MVVVGEREPDIEYYVLIKGQKVEQRTNDASRFDALNLCRECNRFIPTKPEAHMILHKANYHGRKSKRDHSRPR